MWSSPHREPHGEVATVSRTRKQRGPLLSSVVMVMMATAATGLLVVVGFQAMPESIVPSTFGGQGHENREVDVSDSPSPDSTGSTSSPAKSTSAPAEPTAQETRGGERRTPSRGSATTTSAPAPTTAPTTKPPASTAPTTPPPTTAPSSPSPTCNGNGNGHKPKCPKVASPSVPGAYGPAVTGGNDTTPGKAKRGKHRVRFSR